MADFKASSSETGRATLRLTQAVFWLRGHQSGVLVVVFLAIATAFVLDLLIPGYAIAGFYLVPLLIVAFALRGRILIAFIGLLCLALTVLALVIQERADTQNILLIGFGALAGLGLIALGYLYDRVVVLYGLESATNARLHSLTTQLQRLQEMSVLDTDRPLADLLDYIASQALELLEGDACVLFHHDAARGLLASEAAAGIERNVISTLAVETSTDPAGEVVRERRPVATTDLRPHRDNGENAEDAPTDWILHYGACVAVPLEAATDFWGVLAVYYRRPRSFSDEVIRLAQSFGANAALAIENGRLREQLERGAAEAERSRLARDLHDSVTQALFAASIQAEALHSRWRPASEEARQSLEDVHRLTRGALAEMRSLLLEMRPGALGQTPLPSLLRHLADSVAARSDTSVQCSLGDQSSLPPDVTVALYRIAQEAMNNVVHHSRATRAWIALERRDGAVELVVGDDGRGFDSGPVGSEHLGLQIMGERAATIGAVLDVSSTPGSGTVVTARWSGEGVKT
jgi:signal transduction histidine kinase